MEVQQRFEIRFSNVSLPSPNLNPAYHKAVFLLGWTERTFPLFERYDRKGESSK
ncbi:hypothetical protein BATR1942_09410 [Bacillus atrophaeus 1942]|uniref:Uncharacterized protein n=1 Tax=Bacillus atrophaeus (strain 1942) TaxID=720555 RepID=A0ABN3ZAQ8_BACA1|nr:hypothetical protein BATR1942_09410 [Bacillus atrophaeus 1942]AKL84979.1 hypothetical protein D068_cds23400 [Bacillus atrophaeus UCMB-5137]EIM12064.1 hypothetical protein UY9_03943 [Bacillus atrophaeus C89]